MNFSHFNFGNNFVSMHEFSSTTKIVETVPQNISFIPPSTSHEQCHNQDQVSSPNNGHITVIQHQNYIQNASARVMSPNSSPAVNMNTPSTSATAQTSWIDGTSTISLGQNMLKINVPSFPPLSQGIENHPLQGPCKTIIMKDASTMTDNEITVTHITIVQQTAVSEDSKDSLKSETHSVKKSECSNLLRLQPLQIPQDMQDFLGDNNLLPGLKNDVNQERKKITETNDAFAGKYDIRLSNSADGSPVFYCGECNTGYSDKEQLDRHFAGHKSTRRFECDVCGVFLKRKEHLDQHKRGHSEERPFVCKICCKGFKRNEHLRRHNVIHSGDKNYTCIRCGKAFSRKDHLNKHFQTHISKKGKSEQSDPTSSFTH